MEIEVLKRKIIDLITQDLGKALVYTVEKIKPDTAIFTVIKQTEARFHFLNNQNNSGVINFDQHTLETNKIRNSFINVVRSLAEEDVSDYEYKSGNIDHLLLEKLRESAIEIEKLKTDFQNIVANPPTAQSVYKVYLDGNPEIQGRPTDYTCRYTILDINTGLTHDNESVILEDAGKFMVILRGIEANHYVKINISKKDNSKSWASDDFHPQSSTRTLKIT